MKVIVIALVSLVGFMTAGCDASQKDKNVTYQIVGRNGVTYRVTNAPAGLSKEQIKLFVLRKHPEAGTLPPMYIPDPTFHGYECVDDCGGHEAGYQWAEEQGITDPDECGGNSQSFQEGCRAYAEEQGY